MPWLKPQEHNAHLIKAVLLSYRDSHVRREVIWQWLNLCFNIKWYFESCVKNTESEITESDDDMHTLDAVPHLGGNNS
jgi:hypothetical protein